MQEGRRRYAGGTTVTWSVCSVLPLGGLTSVEFSRKVLRRRICVQLSFPSASSRSLSSRLVLHHSPLSCCTRSCGVKHKAHGPGAASQRVEGLWAGVSGISKVFDVFLLTDQRKNWQAETLQRKMCCASCFWLKKCFENEHSVGKQWKETIDHLKEADVTLNQKHLDTGTKRPICTRENSNGPLVGGEDNGTKTSTQDWTGVFQKVPPWEPFSKVFSELQWNRQTKQNRFPKQTKFS